MPQERIEVEITNRNRSAVHTIGRRFRTDIPRTLTLPERQLAVVRGNPWLWITGEDWDGPGTEQIVSLDTLTVGALKERLRALDLPVSGTKSELIARLEEANTDSEDDVPGDEEGSSEEE